MVSQNDNKSFLNVYLSYDPSDTTSDSRAAVNGLSERAKCSNIHTYPIHKYPYPGRLAYIHVHPLMIVAIDTIPSDDGDNKGTGGGGGE